MKRPQDKAIVERTIQIFQRWFFMRVRNRTFMSLLELNACLREHLALFNQKRHRIFRKTRAEMFEAERGHLMSLPKDRYQVSTHSKAKLSRDCHLVFDRNFYSAPHQHRGLELDVWATESTVEIYHKAERVAFHARSKTESKFVTNTSHYPPEHQAYLEEEIVKSKAWASQVGPRRENSSKRFCQARIRCGICAGPRASFISRENTRSRGSSTAQRRRIDSTRRRLNILSA